MDLADALRTLGLLGEGEFDPTSLKRAYLKQVKLHPPEGDPSGFQRVREAYDLLRGLPPPFLRQRLDVPRPDPLPVSAAHEVIVRDPEPSVVEPSKLPEAPEPTVEDAAGDGFFEPPSDEALDENVSGAEENSTPDPRAALAEAYALLQQALRDQRPKAAANALLEIYAQANLETEVPSPSLTLDVILRLFDAGAVKRARRLFSAFERHMALVAVPLNSAVGARWRLVQELVALSPNVSADLVRALSEAIQSSQFQPATLAVQDEVRYVGRDRLEALMRARAPSLFNATWAAPKQRAASGSRSGVPWMIRLGLFALFGLSRLLCNAPPSTSYEPASYRQHAPAVHTPAAVSESASTDTESAESADASGGSAARVAAVLSDADRQYLLPQTQKVESAYLAGKCDELPIAWLSYLTAAHELRELDAVSRSYTYHRARAIAVCPLLASELPEQP